MSYQTDITIVGAGVVGLAIASKVASEDRRVYVLEKNETFGQEQSSRNSEVIHAGIYYPKDSLKRKMCMEGNILLYELCERHGIGYEKTGKIIIATDDIEAGELEELYERGKDNGVDLEMLSQREMNQLIPNIRAVSAFFSPSTGIIDSHGLMRYFLGSARDNGAQVAYKTKVIGMEKTTDGYEVRVEDSSGCFSFMTNVVVNCAGLYADRVAEMAGINIDKAEYRQHWCKGEYFSVTGAKNKLIDKLVYPVPTAISVGIHICFDVTHRMRLGPRFYYVNEIDYKVDNTSKKAFCESSVMKALPFIESSDLEPEQAGVMTMLQGEGEDFRDFVIKNERDRGLPGFINLIGIGSPGLTTSPAIARYVSNLVDEALKN